MAANKVCTAQYFLWWLPFLVVAVAPAANALDRGAVARWAGAAALWLAAAYGLEVRGDANHTLLWACSCLFFAASVKLFEAVLAARRRRGKRRA